MIEMKCECQKNDCPRKKCCVDLILTILLVLFAFVIGLIIGALTGILVLLALSGFIAVAVLLGILILIRIIMLICNKKYC